MFQELMAIDRELIYLFFFFATKVQLHWLLVIRSFEVYGAKSPVETTYLLV
jgi:hypothetical protein